mmetsp:Transcript_99502/g.306883  ORF Transcript_99502/g.306883 Transcript_99502/m.306883 type:complete len:532 (-) Transcript_99502:85-1680(-)
MQGCSLGGPATRGRGEVRGTQRASGRTGASACACSGPKSRPTARHPGPGRGVREEQGLAVRALLALLRPMAGGDGEQREGGARQGWRDGGQGHLRTQHPRTRLLLVPPDAGLRRGRPALLRAGHQRQRPPAELRPRPGTATHHRAVRDPARQGPGGGVPELEDQHAGEGRPEGRALPQIEGRPEGLHGAGVVAAPEHERRGLAAALCGCRRGREDLGHKGPNARAPESAEVLELSPVNSAPQPPEQRGGVAEVRGRYRRVPRVEGDGRAHARHEAVHPAAEEAHAAVPGGRRTVDVLPELPAHALQGLCAAVCSEELVGGKLSGGANLGVDPHVLLRRIHGVELQVGRPRPSMVPVQPREEGHARLPRPRHVGAPQEKRPLEVPLLHTPQGLRQQALAQHVRLAQTLAVGHLHLQAVRDQLARHAVAGEGVPPGQVLGPEVLGERWAVRVHGALKVVQTAGEVALGVSGPAGVRRALHAGAVADEDLHLQEPLGLLRALWDGAPVLCCVAVLLHDPLVIVCIHVCRQAEHH